jgi:hypothetical protein
MNPAKTIYLVDDDQDDRFFIKEAIQGADTSLQIVEVENGLDLLELIQKQETPFSFPHSFGYEYAKMNGLETVSAIRAFPALSDIPVDYDIHIFQCRPDRYRLRSRGQQFPDQTQHFRRVQYARQGNNRQFSGLIRSTIYSTTSLIFLYPRLDSSLIN